MESLLADLRFGLRAYARKPLVAATIVGVLAIGIGVNSALYSVIQAFTQRPAPAIPRDASLVRVYGLGQEKKGARTDLRELSYAELNGLAAHGETFRQVAGWVTEDVILQRPGGTDARGISAEFVTPDFFRTLGVYPAAGTTFAGSSTEPELAAVVSASLVKSFGQSSAEIVGAKLLVNGVSVRVVGVAPARFQGAVPHPEAPAMWLPVSARPSIARTSSAWLTDSARFSVVARLATGVEQRQATAIARRVATTSTPDDGSPRVLGAEVLPVWAPPPVTGIEQLTGFAALGVVAILILLVACTNVSSLLLALAVGRRHEIAVRLSLGASRARLIRQLVTESALLAVAGGFAGLLIYWALTTTIASRMASITVDVSPDLGTVAFTMLVAIATGLLFGLSPALHATGAPVATALRDSGTGMTGRSRLQRLFVGAQIVFSQPLLVLLALLLTVLIPAGASLPKSVESTLVSVQFRPIRRPSDQAARLQSLDRIRTTLIANHGAVAVVPEPAAFSLASVQLEDQVLRLHIEGTPPGYFAAIGIPVILGRDLSFEDTAASEIRVLVPSDLARKLWGGANPIGREIVTRRRDGRAQDSAKIVVVGMYDGALGTTRGGDDRIYTSYGSMWRDDALLVRTRSAASQALSGLQAALRSEAPELPPTRMEPMVAIADRDRQQSLMVSAAAMGAGGLALFLTSIGLFAVVSIAVGQRRREIGLRIALGGTPMRVARMFFGSGLRLSAFGLLAGLPMSALAARLMISQGMILVPEVNMPLIGVAIGVVVLLVASAASWLPARKAARVDPSVTLRAS